MWVLLNRLCSTAKIAVYSCLKIGLLGTEWNVGRENPKQGGYVDLEVSRGNEIFIMELKSLQTSYFNEFRSYAQQKGSDWTNWNVVTQWDKDVLNKKSKDQHLQMLGTFILHNDSKVGTPNTSVSQILEKAKNQLTHYMKLTKEKDSTKIVHGYVLIRVGLSAIISHKIDSM